MFELSGPYDLILHRPCEKFDFLKPQIDIANFGKALVQFMYDNNALGVSANQVGYPYQVFAMRGSPENFVIINPKIIDKSDELNKLEEGCLSYKNLIVNVSRPKWVEMRCSHPDGTTKNYKWTGMTASVAQHEFSHLQGRTYFDDCGLLEKEKALKRWKKLWKI